MGNGGSSLVDCVQDADTARLKEQLSARLADVQSDALTDEELHNELEDAVHAALSMEIVTPQLYQQLQIALELILQLAPTALQSSACNTSGWTALHRACVTGNLSFVAFLFHRYAAQIKMERDAFGLLPLDLVPPEFGTIDFVGSSSSSSSPSGNDASPGKGLPRTDSERVALALRLLHTAKRDVQRAAVEPYFSNQTDTDDGNQSEYFISFETNRDRLLVDAPQGSVHQLHLPLRVRYCLPRLDPFLHGYFQLIWRADDQPRSEEPHYERHVLLRDSVDLDHAATIMKEDLESNQRETRKLHDEEDDGNSCSQGKQDPQKLLTGCVPLEVAHLADDVVCHVLFVASDKFLMKRAIVLTTEGVRLVQTEPLETRSYTSAFDDDDDEHAYEYKGDDDSDADEDGDGFVFHVGAETFTHPSDQLAGLSFDTIDEFEAFVKQLRDTTTGNSSSINTPKTTDKITQSITITTTDGKQDCVKDDVVRRPSILRSNQDLEEEDDAVAVVVGKDGEPLKDNQEEAT